MSREGFAFPDSADELLRLIESYVRVQISDPFTGPFVFGSRATALEMAAALTVGDRLRTQGELFEKDRNCVDWADRLVQTRSLPMTYQPKNTEPTS